MDFLTSSETDTYRPLVSFATDATPFKWANLDRQCFHNPILPYYSMPKPIAGVVVFVFVASWQTKARFFLPSACEIGGNRRIA